MRLKTGGRVRTLSEKPHKEVCILKGVQILAGILAILSAVMLVVFFAKLDDIISRQYFKIFEVSLRG